MHLNGAFGIFVRTEVVLLLQMQKQKACINHCI